MSKEAIIIQSFNDVKRQYEYSVKGYDVTESVKILLKRHKEEYDKEKKIFAGIDGYLEAQKEYQSQIAYLEAKLAKSENQCRECKHLNKKIELNIKNKLMAENCELQKQLEEKDKEIEYYKKQAKKFNNEAQKYYEDAYCNDFQKQTKTSFAIAELEKVKSAFGLINSKLDKVETIKEYIHYIDHQIKQLKEMK